MSLFPALIYLTACYFATFWNVGTHNLEQAISILDEDNSNAAKENNYIKSENRNDNPQAQVAQELHRLKVLESEIEALYKKVGRPSDYRTYGKSDADFEKLYNKGKVIIYDDDDEEEYDGPERTSETEIFSEYDKFEKLGRMDKLTLEKKIKKAEEENVDLDAFFDNLANEMPKVDEAIKETTNQRKRVKSSSSTSKAKMKSRQKSQNKKKSKPSSTLKSSILDMIPGVKDLLVQNSEIIPQGEDLKKEMGAAVKDVIKAFGLGDVLDENSIENLMETSLSMADGIITDVKNDDEEHNDEEDRVVKKKAFKKKSNFLNAEPILIQNPQRAAKVAKYASAKRKREKKVTKKVVKRKPKRQVIVDDDDDEDMDFGLSDDDFKESINSNFPEEDQEIYDDEEDHIDTSSTAKKSKKPKIKKTHVFTGSNLQDVMSNTALSLVMT